jgi:hypothetical protein
VSDDYPPNVFACARKAITEGLRLLEELRVAEKVDAERTFEARRLWHRWYDGHSADLLALADATLCRERINAEWDARFRDLRASDVTGDAAREHLAALFMPDRDTQTTRIHAAIASIGARHAGAL